MPAATNDFEALLLKIAQSDEFRADFESDRGKSLDGFRLTNVQRTFLLALNVGMFVALLGASIALAGPKPGPI